MTSGKHNKKLAESLRPLMYLSQFLGVTFSSHICAEKFRFTVIYRVVVLTILALLVLNEIPAITFWSRNLGGIQGMMAFIETRLRWFALIVNFLMTTLSNTRINNTISNLVNSSLVLKQKEYNKIFWFQFYIIISTFLLITFYMCLGHDVLWFNLYHRWYTSTIYIVTEFYIGFPNLQFVIMLFAIKKYFKSLNEILSESDFNSRKSGHFETFVFFTVKNHRRDNIGDIVKFRQVHMNLTNACWQTNRCFSLQILLFLVVSLVEITYSLRSITVYAISPNKEDVYNQMYRKPLLELALILTWGGYYFWSILQIIMACEHTILESLKTSAVVHDLINKTEDKEVAKQLFSLQLMNHQVFFSAGKFVALNFPLLNSIIGTVTTYLVIIITFSS